jgi:5-methylcytosine-specific restriction endonuclease McrA
MAKVKVIYGAPGSGKSTYAKNIIGANDLLYDFDDIMACLTGLPYQVTNESLISYVTDIRNLIIDKLHSDNQIDTAYIITTFISQELKEKLDGLNPEYIQMETTMKVCMERLDKSDRDDKEQLAKVIHDWYEKYDRQQVAKQKRQAEYTGNPFYKTKRWQKKREVVLRRDQYECRECRRYGRTKAAKVVHHVFTLEEYPQYKMNTNNLISLCVKCHEGMHIREWHMLSDIGKAWMERLREKVESESEI